MFQFKSEIEQIEIGAVAGFIRRADTIYQDNMQAYVKIVLRRPFAKIIVCCAFSQIQIAQV
jgi:exocyst complex component 1